MSHVLGFEDVIQLGFGEQIFLEQNEFVNAPICDEGSLGYGGTLFVAEHRVEGSNVASQATEIAMSAPMIWKQTLLTTSGITGFTLPGMMEEPGCIGGRWSSYSPQRGPDESQRKSLQILDSCTAAVFITPLINANSPESCVASTRSPASLLCS
jgi:hypothetical protein